VRKFFTNIDIINNKNFKVIPLIEILFLMFLIVIPLLVNDFLTIIFTRMLILSIFALSFDLCWGYAGILTFGQSLFFGIAGYVTALFANKLGFVQLWGVFLIGISIGFLSSFLVAWFLLLGKKTPQLIFIALGTLTTAYAAERLVSGWYWVGGGNGLSIFEFLKFGNYDLEPGVSFYYLATFFLIAVYLLCKYLVKSQFGLVLAGIRQNENRLSYLGYKVQIYKAIVFCFSGSLAGLAGALYAHHEGFIGPGNMGIVASTYAVLYGLFGGVGTLIGPVLGVFFIEGIKFKLSDIDALKSYWPILLGIILLLVVVYKPSGLLGFIINDKERFGKFGVINIKSLKKFKNKITFKRLS